MCQQVVVIAGANIDCAKQQQQQKMKTTYSIKKVLKTFFRKQSKQQNAAIKAAAHTQSLESLEESLDNLRNLQMEQQQLYEEIDENYANEKLADLASDEEIYVPVRFARTEAGTFFWTTNLQPVMSTIAPAVDEDLVQPAFCYSNQQHPYMQYQDRLAQA